MFKRSPSSLPSCESERATKFNESETAKIKNNKTIFFFRIHNFLNYEIFRELFKSFSTYFYHNLLCQVPTIEKHRDEATAGTLIGSPTHKSTQHTHEASCLKKFILLTEEAFNN